MKNDRMVSPFALFQQQNSIGGPLFRGDLIKLNHITGEWYRLHGKVEIPIPIDTRAIVNPCEMIDSWTKFSSDGEKPETLVYHAANFEFAPPRESLGDNEPRRWRGGKDPFQRACYLPMLIGGEVCAFKATGKSAIAEIGDLCAMYDSADRNGRLPEITTDSRSFEANGSRVFVPVFKLVGWGTWENGLLVQQPSRRMLSEITKEAKALPKPPETPPEDDLDDSIPF